MKPLKPIISTKIYFPGLISAILLPMACVVYLYFYRPKYGMNVSWFDKKAIERLNKNYSENIDFENFRIYNNLYLTGDAEHDKIELIRLEKLADSLVAKNDYKNGIKVVLTNKTKFQDIVTSLNIGMNHKPLGMIPFDANIYIFKLGSSVPRYTINKKPLLFSQTIFLLKGPLAVFSIV
jgi:hypothetical protein